MNEETMFEFDVKKITQTPKDQWEAINMLVNKEQELITALHIMASVIENSDPCYTKIHENQIKKFLSNYTV